MATLYTLFVAWRVMIEDGINHTPGHGCSVVFALISTVVVALLIQGHFMLRSEHALSALKATAAETRAAINDLQGSATVGGIGLYRIDQCIYPTAEPRKCKRCPGVSIATGAESAPALLWPLRQGLDALAP